MIINKKIKKSKYKGNKFKYVLLLNNTICLYFEIDIKVSLQVKKLNNQNEYNVLKKIITKIKLVSKILLEYIPEK